MTRKHNAFTLVELLIVVVILAILAAVVIPQFTGAAEETKYSGNLSTASEMTRLVTAFEKQCGFWPGMPDDGSGAAADFDGDKFKADLVRNDLLTTTGNPYGPVFDKFPTNPFLPAASNDTVEVQTITGAYTASDLDVAIDNNSAWVVFVIERGWTDQTGNARTKVAKLVVKPGRQVGM
jgi:prepilin-type N-terminal cleavage/methylation domain-containing protein